MIFLDGKLLQEIFREINTHSLIGLESGALLLIGGTDFNKEIWKLEKGNWSIAGNLKNVKNFCQFEKIIFLGG